MSIALVWFRSDLRVTDHAPLAAAARSGRPVMCLFVANAPDMIGTPTPKAAYLDACLNALDEELVSLGSRLLQRYGQIAAVFTELHRQYGVDTIYTHGAEPTLAGVEQVAKAQAWCQRAGVSFRAFDHPGTEGDAAAEKLQRSPLPAPVFLSPAATDLPPRPQHNAPPGSVSRLAGKRAALQRLRRATQTDTKGPAADAGVWPDLALGVVSAREVYTIWSSQLAAFTANRAFDDVRRQARLMEAWQNRLLLGAQARERLLRQNVYRPTPDTTSLRADYLLAVGQTGVPLIDACMRALTATGELNRIGLKYVLKGAVTGFGMSPQHIADLVGHVLIGADEAWLHGLAHRYETEARTSNRRPDIVQLAQMIDPQGVFVRCWVPELALLGARDIHTPWMAGARALSAAGCRIGETYPLPALGAPKFGAGRSSMGHNKAPSGDWRPHLGTGPHPGRRQKQTKRGPHRSRISRPTVVAAEFGSQMPLF